jgi:hypothetical protein
MNKREVSWLLVRIAGLWFIWQALENILSIVVTYWVASSQQELLSRSAGFFLPSTVRIVIYLALAFYCLGAGHLIFDLLRREPKVGDDQVQPPGRTLI